MHQSGPHRGVLDEKDLPQKGLSGAQMLDARQLMSRTSLSWYIGGRHAAATTRRAASLSP